MCVEEDVQLCMHRCVGGGQRLISGVSLQVSFILLFETGSLIGLEIAVWARLTGQGVSGMYMCESGSPALEIQASTTPHSDFLTWVLEIRVNSS